MPRLLALVLIALVVCPAAATAKKVVRGSSWDLRVTTKTTYVYDQLRADGDEPRKGSGSVTSVLTAKDLVIPRKRVGLARYATRLEGRQTPGALTYVAPAGQRCEGKLTNGGGETAYGDDEHRDELPTTTTRSFAVTKTGIAIGFGLLARYDRCAFQGGEMGLPRSERSPFAFDLPAAGARTASRRSAGRPPRRARTRTSSRAPASRRPPSARAAGQSSSRGRR
jgi:hypothetical protein